MRLILLTALVVGTLAARDLAKGGSRRILQSRGPTRDDTDIDCEADPSKCTNRNTDPACGSCAIPHDSAGCSVQTIEDCVCAVDDFCCGASDGVWDTACVATVHEACGGEYCFIDSAQECAGTCGTANYGFGCSVPEIEECVCSYDAWCCDIQWDSQCVDEAWHSPCYTDCDCQGDDHVGGASMPPYWSALGTTFGVNETHLGFNAAAGKWCYSYSNTCIKWGEWNGACDASTFACAGGNTNGYGNDQMALVAEMEAMGDRRHYACPDCYDKNPCESRAIPGTATGPIYTDCDCNEHFIGEPLIEDGYWWLEAEDAGVHAEHISYFDQQWYDHETPTCVAMGSYADPCDSASLGLVCAGQNGDTFGSALAQMTAILAADANGGSHPACPVL